jgi:predicted CoA-substrate-specific enzyme activase
VSAIKEINELTALAKGVAFLHPDETTILDIGGQDTKIIKQENGLLKSFFLNDKCAAGSGLFLMNVCNMLNVSLHDISLCPVEEIDINLSSVCAVFAQSEIVELIAANVDGNRIVSAVVKQILIQAKLLVGKLYSEQILLTGGLANIKNIDSYASDVLEKKCIVSEKGQFFAAIGAALSNL